MRALLMSEPAVVDSLEFARTGQQLAGTVAVSELRRVADSLFDDQGTLEYAIKGRTDSRGRPRLRVEVRGEVHLRCQRCLGSLPYRVATASDLLVLTGGGPETDALEDLDGVAADPHTSVRELVEDEVLLALPMAPRHPEGQCGAAVSAGSAQSRSPFGVLAQLKHDRKEQ
ncbi:MAG TPA: YceD family protein [Burkholderiales bacterium]|nr:YceD family protein [Burkholderiales bacterium]